MNSKARGIFNPDFIAVMDDETMIYVKDLVEENLKLKSALIDVEQRLNILRRYHGGDGSITRQQVMEVLSKEGEK